MWWTTGAFPGVRIGCIGGELLTGSAITQKWVLTEAPRAVSSLQATEKSAACLVKSLFHHWMFTPVKLGRNLEFLSSGLVTFCSTLESLEPASLSPVGNVSVRRALISNRWTSMSITLINNSLPAWKILWCPLIHHPQSPSSPSPPYPSEREEGGSWDSEHWGKSYKIYKALANGHGCKNSKQLLDREKWSCVEFVGGMQLCQSELLWVSLIKSLVHRLDLSPLSLHWCCGWGE